MTARSPGCLSCRFLRLARHNTHHDLLLPTPLLPLHPLRRIFCTCVDFAGVHPLPEMYLVPLESLSLADCSPPVARILPPSLSPRCASLSSCLRGPLRTGVRHNILPSSPSVKLFPSLFFSTPSLNPPPPPCLTSPPPPTPMRHRAYLLHA